MPDINDILNHAKRINEEASANQKAMQESFEEAQQVFSNYKKRVECAAQPIPEETQDANTQRRVEILGQVLEPGAAQQPTVTEAQIQAEVERQVAEYAAKNVDEMMGKLFGDDMGVLAAALDTLAEMEGIEDDVEDDDLSPEMLSELLEAKMSAVEALPEHAPILYGDSLEQWQRFGILLSGIISHLNQHELSSLDVEEHIPVMEQQIANVVRNAWGIRGREQLLDTLRYLTQDGGYRLRYRTYAEAAAAEELFEPDMDEDDRANIRQGWMFVQRFKETYPSQFLLGWDIGRAAMLTRWGYFLGWLTSGEAVGILSDLSQAALSGLGSWREFGRSYQFGGVFWKILCGAEDGGSYLESLTRAVTELLTDTGDACDGGQWQKHPWPAVRKTQ